MELLTSGLLRSRHGFPGRTGGVSVGDFAALNTSTSVGDDPAHVAENLARLARAAGIGAEAFATVSQVHGDRVLRAVGGGGQGEADALWTSRRTVAVAVRTADCLPVLMEDPRTGAVAAVHAGWRGVVAGVAARAVEALEAHGARRDELRVAVGPFIQRCCFEVDGELPERFGAAFGHDVVVPVPGRVRRHLDLGLALRRGLTRAGLQDSLIDVLSTCTACDARFFSHRRDRGRTGRHLSFIVCDAAGL